MLFTKKNFSLCLFLLTTVLYFSCDSAKDAVGGTTVSQNVAPKKMETGGSITFAAANNRYSANGEFKSWHFTKMDVKTNKASEIKSIDAAIEIDITSIWEKSPKLTNHLKAPDFFNIAEFTTATMDINNVKKQSDGTYTVDMKLKMKGLTQDMTSTFTVTNTNPLHVKGTALVNRNLFSLGKVEMKVPEMIEVTYDTDLPES
jgi:Uncharacterized conserved protein